MIINGHCRHVSVYVNSVLVAYGQTVCRPVSPYCNNCIIKAECPRIGVTKELIKEVEKSIKKKPRVPKRNKQK